MYGLPQHVFWSPQRSATVGGVIVAGCNSPMSGKKGPLFPVAVGEDFLGGLFSARVAPTATRVEVRIALARNRRFSPN